MAECLFLCHRMPYPPNKGDKIRAFYWLRALAERYRVHLGAFVDDRVDWAHQQTLAEYCDRQCYRPLPGRRARARSVAGLWRGEALSFGYYRDRALARWVEQTLDQRPIDVVLAFSSTMGPYVEHRDDVRRVLDFVDVDSDKWGQYAASVRAPMRWVYAREARRLRAGERRLAAAFDASLFVSEAEADFFRQAAPESAPRVHAIENGVDGDYFDPARVAPARAVAGTGARIVFTGTMDYAPNVDAVSWFVESVLPAVRRRRPDAEFAIVGARPNASVRALAAHDGVTVVGAVDDMRPYLAGARVAVAPMRIARGIQNKVLEALAMGCPVVLSARAAAGLAPLPEPAAFVADEPGDFAARVVAALASDRRAEAGKTARRFVLDRYAWRRRFEQLFEQLAPDESSQRGAA